MAEPFKLKRIPSLKTPEAFREHVASLGLDLPCDDAILPQDVDDPEWSEKAVHLKDAHFEAGMHCIDCHTKQDVHGDGKLYVQMTDATEIFARLKKDHDKHRELGFLA